MCRKKWWSLILCLAIITLFSACDSDDTKNETDNGKIKVSVTFNALKEFVEAVGKEKVQITTIIPDGTEPHDFEPKAQDLINLNSADVFVYNGLEWKLGLVMPLNLLIIPI